MDKFAALKKGHTWLVSLLIVLLMVAPSFYFSVASDDIFDEPREYVFVVLASLAIVLIEGRRALEGRAVLGGGAGTWAHRLLLAFLGWAALSTFWAVNASVAWPYLVSLGAVALAGVSILGWLEEAPGRAKALLAGAAALVGTQLAVASMQLARLPLEDWGKQLPALAIGGKALPGGFWPYDTVISIGRIGAGGLPVGTLGNVNYLAELLCLTLPLLAAWAFSTSRRWVRWPIAALVVAAMGLMIATGSRAALLGLLVAAPLSAVSVWGRSALNLAGHWQHPSRRLFIGVGVVVGIGLAGLSGAKVVQKIQAISVHDKSIEARLVNWQAGVDLVKQRPVQGVGMGNYKVVNLAQLHANHPKGLDEAVSDNLFLRAHNEPLQVLIELGLIGLALLGAFVVAWWRQTVRNFALPPAMRFGVVCGVGALLVAGCFGFPFHVPVTAVALGLVVAMGMATARDEAVVQPLPLAWRAVYAVVAVGLVGGVGALAVQKVYWPQFQAHEQLFAGRALHVNARHAEAARVYGAVDRTARFRGIYRIEYARALVNSQRYDDALRLLESSQREGLAFEATYWKARALWGLGRKDEALAAYGDVTAFFSNLHWLHGKAVQDVEAIKRGATPTPAGG